MSATCSIEGCDFAVFVRGWCRRHYCSWHAHGDPMAARERGRTVAERIASNVSSNVPEECWEWQGSRNDRGYGAIRVSGRSLLAHRAAWEAAHGPIPEGLCVCHRCDNPTCCNPAHLFLGTRRDNNLDMYAKGRNRHPKGNEHGLRKHPEAAARGVCNAMTPFSETDITEIRVRWANGEAQRALARSFGVSKTTVRNIVLRRTWAHVA